MQPQTKRAISLLGLSLGLLGLLGLLLGLLGRLELLELLGVFVGL